MRIRRGWLLVALVVATAAGVALTPLSTHLYAPAPAEADAFRAFMAPRLTTLLASAETVRTLVDERSRNILALRAESDRITTLTDDIDRYLEREEIPAWAEPVVADYRAGLDLLRTAIDGANLALRSFDFSEIPRLIPVFSEGTDRIERALRTLDESGDRGFVVH